MVFNISQKQHEGRLVKLLHHILDRSWHHWTIVGPFTVVAILLAALIKGSGTLFVPFAALVGIPLCWIGQMRGFYIASTLLFASFLKEFPAILPQDQLWHIGMGISIVVSFLITTMTQLEWHTILPQKETIDFEKETLIRERSKVQSEYTENLAKLEIEITSLQKQISSNTQEQQEAKKTWLHEMHLLTEKLQAKEKKLLQLKQEHDSLSTQISALKKELENKDESSPLAASPPQIDVALERALRISEGQLTQLRHQFQEKSALLEQTRKQLFHADELVLQMQREKIDCDSYAEARVQEAIVKLLSADQNEIEETILAYQQEVDNLHQIIDTLTKESA
jgi:hypothetical protein